MFATKWHLASRSRKCRVPIALVSLFVCYQLYVQRATVYYCINSVQSVIYNELYSLPMHKYKWPLGIDAHKVVRDYKQGKLTMQPIYVDKTNITLLPDKKHCRDKSLVTVLIKTRVDDRYNRDVLRRTWTQDLTIHNLQHSFLLGQCSSKECQDNLNSELLTHRDIVQGDFIDTYFNNTRKFRMGLKYIAYHCNTTSYLLIIDGDYSLNVDRLIQYLKDLGYPKDLYAGKLWRNSQPFRNSNDPHYLTFDFYPFRTFPPFIAAGASIMSAEIIEPMLIISKFTKYIKFDDVFYGIVAKKLGVQLTDASSVLPSWYVPSLRDSVAHNNIIGSHRFGSLTEVEMIHRMIHNK